MEDANYGSKTMAISELTTQLALIVPTNVCETNLRRVYEIYLSTVSANIEADSSQLADLEVVATQCPLEGGPGVFIAGILYQGFTGIFPIQDTCNVTDERGVRKTSKPHASMSIYPNPNKGNFIVNIPKGFANQNTLLRILDAHGSFLKTVTVNGEHVVALDLTEQPSGLYFLSLLGDAGTTEALPFIIQH